MDGTEVVEALSFLHAPQDVSWEEQQVALLRKKPPHRITSKVYLGNYLSATDYSVLSSLDIGHIVNASNHFGNKHKDEGIRYCTVNVDDVPFADLKRYFQRAIDFVEQADGPVAIHCAAGVSRSASIVMAYLMYKHHLNVRQAATVTHSRRSVVSPNPGFLSQLVEYDIELGRGAGIDPQQPIRFEDLLLDRNDDSSKLVWNDHFVVGYKESSVDDVVVYF